MDPINDPLSPAQKPGGQTIEGKIATLVAVAGVIATVLGALADAGLLGHGNLALIVGALLSAAASLGIGGFRTKLKIQANSDTAKAAALIEAAKANPTQPQP